MAAGLAVILLVGGWLRLSGLNWDERQHLHPDERFLTMVVAAERWPASLAEYLDEARSPLNPRNVGFAYFTYGTLPTTLVKGLSLLFERAGYDEVPLVGRAASAFADLGSLVFLVLLAQRLYRDPRVSLLAGALFAVSVLPIQQSHFFVVDTFATCFVTAALWALSGRPESARTYAAAGLYFGLALACKASVFPLVVVIAATAVPVDGTRRIRSAALRLAVAGIATFVAFRLAQPDAFAGPGLLGLAPSARWVANLVYTRQLLSGAIDFPPGVQWADRSALLFSLDNLVRWNLGPLLGVTACAAVVWAGWRLAARQSARHLIPMLWVALVFVPQSTQFVKAGRYLLPIYPVLALLASWLIVRVWDLTATRDGRTSRLRVAAGLAASIVCLGTLLWAVAFTSVYRQPNTRVSASRWIYEHVPAGSSLATEYWDDRLPLRLATTAPVSYTSVELRPYDDDTPSKADTLLNQLDASDYIILASNRLYDSIPRLPMRYPMTTRYYGALLGGTLGFERVAEFVSYPALGGSEFPDQSAEEAFSVYDHARVQIFRKTDRWSVARAREVLTGGLDWNAVVRLSPARAGTFRNGQLLTTADFDAVRTGGSWSHIFHPDDLANRAPVLAWCGLLAILGLLALPLTMSVFRELPDRGWLLSKLVGLLVVGYTAWLMASLRWLSFSRSSLLLIGGLFAIATSVHVWRRREMYQRFWRERRALVIKEELLFWAAFALFLLVRAGNPDLWHPSFGGEKPMDFAYLNAVIRSERFPPYNPWFAGGYLNYYYFGFVLVAVLTKLTGIVPQVAYNLAIPTFFALTVGGVFTVGHALVTALLAREGRRGGGAWPWVGGLLAALFVTVIGNLVELGLITQRWTDASAARWPNWVWYWSATRVIPHAPAEAPPITEFPFFTFLYGDLHAHLLALPVTLLALALAVTYVLPEKEQRGRAVPATSLVLLGLVLGALYATNTWDYPTYLLVAAAALTFREWRASGPSKGIGHVAAVTSVRLAVVIVLGRLFFAPFFQHYSQAYGSIELWTGSRTPLAAYLRIHGFFAFTLATSLCAWAMVRRRGPRAHRAQVPLPLPALLVAALGALGLALILAVEVVVMANDIGRMNTVFKFYLQVWVLWGTAAAVSATLLMAHWLARAPGEQRGAARIAARAWAAAFVALATACAIYPVVATRARWRDRFDAATGFTLDGQAYMKTARHVELGQTFALGPDLEAMRWLEQHIEGTPVIAEAHTPEYRWGARISTNTGLPTILGWSWHQTQQRASLPADLVTRRAADVDAIYRDVSVDRVLGILDRYRVDYVYVGALERIFYPSAGLEKFAGNPDRWQPVYRNAGVTIYRVVR